MKTKINLSILLTGLIGISSFTAEAQSTRIWARISDLQSTPRVLENGTIGSTNPSFANALNQAGVNEVHQALSNSKNEKLQGVYEFNCQCDYNTLETTLKNFPGVVAEIERAPEYKTLFVPNDYNATFGSNYALDLIKAQQAWDQTQSNAGIIVGISDENLNPFHEEIAGKLTYYDNQNTLPSEHGTAVAIIAAGKTDNQVGVSSIGFNSSIAFYEMNFNQLLAATYAGIDVINLSWFSGCSYSQFEQDVIDEVYANGTFIIAAAGNGTTCGDPSAMAYPASYNHVFSVTSIGEFDNHEEQIGDPHTTHQHNSRVDLSAPGYLVNISDSPVNYTVASGSSYA
ncbi:MAG: S8 family peptidase, partial [Flavobacteriales bacterium]